MELGTRQCNVPNILTGKRDILGSFVLWSAKRICMDSDDTKMSQGSEPIEMRKVIGGVTYYLSISWRKGCKTTVDRMSPGHPLEDAGDGAPRDIECARLLYDNWKECKLSSPKFDTSND